jgi:predicted TIM-barrel fold metal-dependent hydrolase
MSVVVDADGHVLEPPDLWQRYLERKYVDRAIRIDEDANGLEVLLIDGQPLEYMRGTLAMFGGVGMDTAAMSTPGERKYLDGFAPGANDPRGRLSVMDKEGIDIALFYPTIGIFWEGLVKDPQLATAYARAYNRWLVDFCSADASRLKPVAHVSLLDPTGACEEAKRARSEGCVGVMLSPDPGSRGGRLLDDAEIAAFWATLEDLEMPVAFHVVSRPDERRMIADWLGPLPFRVHNPGLRVMDFAFLSVDVMAAFTQMMSLAVFEKFPRLKCGVLEAGATWIAAWLDRMDGKYETIKGDSPMRHLPSEYFRRQCLVSADPDESMLAACVTHVGADHFMWASDYPHVDAHFDVVTELRTQLESLSAEEQAKVLGENAIEFYNLQTNTS